MMNGSLGRNGATKERDLQFSSCKFEFLKMTGCDLAYNLVSFFGEIQLNFGVHRTSEESKRIFRRLTTLSPHTITLNPPLPPPSPFIGRKPRNGGTSAQRNFIHIRSHVMGGTNHPPCFVDREPTIE